MEKIERFLEESFDKGSFDNQSKKLLKEHILTKKYGNEELNLSVKIAFELVKKYESIDNNIFIIEWLQNVVNTLNSLRELSNIKSSVFFSPKDDCIGQIIDFINSASSSLIICVFTISDDRLSRHIYNQHKKGVKVKIITDNEKQFDRGSDIQQLVDAGIEIKIDTTNHHMHHKFAIADQLSLLTGSYNWTRSASEYNQENFIILNDKIAIKQYLDEFYRLWKTCVSL